MQHVGVVAVVTMPKYTGLVREFLTFVIKNPHLYLANVRRPGLLRVDAWDFIEWATSRSDPVPSSAMISFGLVADKILREFAAEGLIRGFTAVGRKPRRFYIELRA